MSGYIGDSPNDCPPSDKDKNVLTLIFGEKTCADDWTTQAIWYLGLAFLATVIFFLLACLPTRKYLGTYIKSPAMITASIVFIFFILVFLLDWFFIQWRLANPLCNQGPPQN